MSDVDPNLDETASFLVTEPPRARKALAQPVSRKLFDETTAEEDKARRSRSYAEYEQKRILGRNFRGPVSDSQGRLTNTRAVTESARQRLNDFIATTAESFQQTKLVLFLLWSVWSVCIFVTSLVFGISHPFAHVCRPAGYSGLTMYTWFWIHAIVTAVAPVALLLNVIKPISLSLHFIKTVWLFVGCGVFSAFMTHDACQRTDFFVGAIIVLILDVVASCVATVSLFAFW